LFIWCLGASPINDYQYSCKTPDKEQLGCTFGCCEDRGISRCCSFSKDVSPFLIAFGVICIAVLSISLLCALAGDGKNENDEKNEKDGKNGKHEKDEKKRKGRKGQKRRKRRKRHNVWQSLLLLLQLFAQYNLL
jgi:hypothetical protein